MPFARLKTATRQGFLRRADVGIGDGQAASRDLELRIVVLAAPGRRVQSVQLLRHRRRRAAQRYGLVFRGRPIRSGGALGRVLGHVIDFDLDAVSPVVLIELRRTRLSPMPIRARQKESGERGDLTAGLTGQLRCLRRPLVQCLHECRGRAPGRVTQSHPAKRRPQSLPQCALGGTGRLFRRESVCHGSRCASVMRAAAFPALFAPLQIRPAPKHRAGVLLGSPAANPDRRNPPGAWQTARQAPGRCHP